MGISGLSRMGFLDLGRGRIYPLIFEGFVVCF